MCITGGESQRNRRIGSPNLIQKQKVGNRWVKAPRRSGCVGDSRLGIYVMLVVSIASW
ncbi:MAG: hypothetical protein LBU34_14690 [Planctomycetaceae bacterium]|jgi:hypothetical protein|nr:hypothetical protein [Planctomycetaceae bacterium]